MTVSDEADVIVLAGIVDEFPIAGAGGEMFPPPFEFVEDLTDNVESVFPPSIEFDDDGPAVASGEFPPLFERDGLFTLLPVE